MAGSIHLSTSLFSKFCIYIIYKFNQCVRNVAEYHAMNAEFVVYCCLCVVLVKKKAFEAKKSIYTAFSTQRLIDMTESRVQITYQGKNHQVVLTYTHV